MKNTPDLTTHFLRKKSEEDTKKYLTGLENDPDQKAKEYALCVIDPWWWLTGWVKTLDEHNRLEPLRPFPDKEYLRRLTDLFLTKSLLAIAKSRQMMISWLFCSLFLCDAAFHNGRRLIIPTKKGDDADALFKRCYFIWENMPDFLKRYPANPGRAGRHTYCRFTIPAANSEIMGLPAGSDQIRMYTASRVLEDEFQLQEEGREILEAVQPTLTGGGGLILVGTAHPGFFEKLIHDSL